MKANHSSKARIVILSLTGTLLLTGCLTSKFEEKNPSQGATNMNELVAPTNFSWTTGQKVEVNITGLPTTIPIQRTISIKGSNDTFYNGYFLMSTDHKMTLLIPSSEKELTLKFGTVTVKSLIQEGKATFSLIPNYVEPTL